MKLYGAVVSAEKIVPSINSSTRVTAKLSLAETLTTVRPLTVAPSFGETNATSGAVRSRFVKKFFAKVTLL